MVITADHMRDAHVMIIHHHGMQIGWCAITPQDDHVVQFAIGDAHFALHQIRDNGLTFQRRLDADGEGLAFLFRPRLTLTPAPVITRRAAFSSGAFAHFGQFFRRGPTAISLAHDQQRFGDFAMPRFPLRLKYRRFIRRKAEPFQAVQDLINRLPRGAFPVRILNP